MGFQNKRSFYVPAKLSPEYRIDLDNSIHFPNSDFAAKTTNFELE